MANRQIARDLAVAPETINRHLARLGRHCLLFHALMMHNINPAKEIVIDGFVSFEWSQYFPFHHHTAVEKQTDFFLYFTDSEVRRSGRMTQQQKRRRDQLERRYGRPDPQAVVKDVGELLSVVTAGSQQVTVFSDNHRAYRRAIGNLDCQVSHKVTSSQARRDQRNPLWEVNLLDLLIRHCSANHKRETIAWSKRRQGSAVRLAVFLIWRNYMKGRREKQRGSPTPAMMRAMCDHPLTAQDILTERLFVTRIDLPARWQQYYWGSVETRAIGKLRKHTLKYAF
ncbi:MAG: hypothetical protein GY832_14485 [Chloroflexi bacterium]|nr:hypothetical protein [Chloroflexota bacterium]